MFNRAMERDRVERSTPKFGFGGGLRIIWELYIDYIILMYTMWRVYLIVSGKRPSVVLLDGRLTYPHCLLLFCLVG